MHQGFSSRGKSAARTFRRRLNGASTVSCVRQGPPRAMGLGPRLWAAEASSPRARPAVPSVAVSWGRQLQARRGSWWRKPISLLSTQHRQSAGQLSAPPRGLAGACLHETRDSCTCPPLFPLSLLFGAPSSHRHGPRATACCGPHRRPLRRGIGGTGSGSDASLDTA
jgi:hypothetical protein